MDVLIAFLAGCLVLQALVAIINCLTFPRLTARRAQATSAKISVLIPARQEARVIAATVRCWRDQDHPAYEVIILDDSSSDETYSLACKAAGSDERIRVLKGAELPAGWKGKNWACWQLAQAARGDTFLFTDADVHWEPTALRSLMNLATRTRADLLTVWPTQVTKGWGERLVVPLMAFAIVGYLPLLAVHTIPWSVFSAANGQCLLFRREAYQAVGGHAAIRASILDDMMLARAIKSHRMRLRMADGAGLITTRMYRSWTEVRDGFAKNILAGHRGSPVLLGISTIFHLMLFISPWLMLIHHPWQAVILLSLGILIRMLTASFSRQRVADALLLPVSVLLMTGIAWLSIRWHTTGGIRWKGRIYEK